MENVQEIKKSVNILSVFQSYGFEFKRIGAEDYATQCPFHEDKTPSLVITPNKGLWHCFGCGADKQGGDVIDFMMKYERIGFKEAVSKLKDKFHLQGSSLDSVVTPNHVGYRAKDPQNDGARTVPAKKENIQISETRTAPQQELLNKVTELYHTTFREDVRGRSYLKSRGIEDERIGEAFQLGYANGKLLEMIPKEGGILEDLKALGLITDQGGEFFKGCVVFPLYDRAENVAHLYGRRVNGEHGKHFYLRGKHRGLFNRQALKSYDEVILAESIIDALSLYQAGHKNVIPLYGINGLSEDHLQSLKQSFPRQVFIFLDGDDGGQKASLALKVQLESELRNVKVFNITPSIAEDANDYLLKYGSDKLAQFVREQMGKAESVSLSGFNSRTPLKKSPEEMNVLTESRLREVEDSLMAEYGERRYTLRGVEGGLNRLKVNIKAQKIKSADKRFHLDTVDLYLSRSRKMFIKEAAGYLKKSWRSLSGI